jgi:hypothetical protein
MLVQIDGIDDLRDITTLPHQVNFDRCRAGQADAQYDANMPSPGFSHTHSASVLSTGPWGTRPEYGGSVKMANFVCNITIYCRHGTGAEFAAELRSL